MAYQDVALAHAPCVGQFDQGNAHAGLTVSRRRFRNNTDAHASTDHAAHGVKAGKLDAQLQRFSKAFHHLRKKGLQRAALLHADGVFVQCFGKGNFLAARKTVVFGSDQHQAVGTEVNRLQAQGIDLAGDDADVGAPVEHTAGDISIRFFLKVDIDLRVAG